MMNLRMVHCDNILDYIAEVKALIDIDLIIKHTTKVCVELCRGVIYPTKYKSRLYHKTNSAKGSLIFYHNWGNVSCWLGMK